MVGGLFGLAQFAWCEMPPRTKDRGDCTPELVAPRIGEFEGVGRGDMRAVRMRDTGNTNKVGYFMPPPNTPDGQNTVPAGSQYWTKVINERTRTNERC